MAIFNTTFASISGTGSSRDSRAEKGANYSLDGSAQSGRLNIASGTQWQVGANTQITYAGNPSSDFMQGAILGTSGMRINMIVSGGGRGDFSSLNGVISGNNTTLAFYGHGTIYAHLQSPETLFTGYLNLELDMAQGHAFIQFSSREYASVIFDIKDTNAATINLFPARVSSGFTSLPGFEVLNFEGTLQIRAGGTSSSHGRIYDPIYHAATNNLLALIRSGGSNGNNHREFFTLDVTALASDDAYISVTDSRGTEQRNHALNLANTTIFANDGTTALGFYAGKRVVRCLVRVISDTPSTSRFTISYLIRRAGFIDVKVDNLAMNAPVIVEAQEVDTSWSNTGTILVVTNVGALYDQIIKLEVADLALVGGVFSGDGVILHGWTLIRDQTIDAPVTLDNQLFEIRVKTGMGGLLATGSIATLTGNVDPSFEGHTNLGFIKENGQVSLTLEDLNPNGFTLPSPTAVFYRPTTSVGAYLKAESTGSTITFDVAPNLEYEIKTYTAGYVEGDIILTIGPFGSTASAGLEPIIGADKLPLYTKAINQALYAASSYEATTLSAHITLETETAQLSYDLPTTFRLLQDVTHLPALVGAFTDPVRINDQGTGFIMPYGNFLRITKSSGTPKVALKPTINRPDGSSIEEGAIKNLDETDLVVAGMEQYHLGDGITITNVSPSVVIPASALQIITDIIPTRIEQVDMNTFLLNTPETTKRLYAQATQAHFDGLIDGLGSVRKASLGTGFTADQTLQLTSVRDAVAGTVPLPTLIAAAVRASILVELGRIDGPITLGPSQTALEAGFLAITPATKAGYKGTSLLSGGLSTDQATQLQQAATKANEAADQAVENAITAKQLLDQGDEY